MSGMEHPVQWTAPSPTWHTLTGTAATAPSPAFTRPTLLRFATDSFMDDYTGTLDVDPLRLAEFTARPETWRGPSGAVQPTAPAPLFARALQRRRLASERTATAVALAEPVVAEPPVLKLYQPSHQRYYLVAASLVCQLPGLPDRVVDSGQQERATFVLRRLIPKSGVKRPTADPSTADEYAYVTNAAGTGWQRVLPTAAGAVAPGEEQLPLFKSQFVGDDHKRRNVLAGLVPASRREAYMHASPMSDPVAALSGGGVLTPAALPQDARITLLQTQVTEPWRQLVTRAASAEQTQKAARSVLPSSGVPAAAVREATRRGVRQQIQTVSWYVLLDLAIYLEQHIPNAWRAINGTGGGVTAAEQALVSAIAATTFTRDSVTRTMKSVLPLIRARETQLEKVTGIYTEGSTAWPSELFSLATVRSSEQLDGTGGTAPSPVESVSGLSPDTLDSLVKAALPATAAGPVSAPPLTTRPVMAPGDAGWFVIRCAYERPRCGPLHPVLVSEPTEVFQLAGFFDPDAPARPIRIGLPVDVSPAGLRKFDKNTAFMVSDVLCGHIKRFKALSLGDLVLSVLPWPFHQDLPVNDGAPCSDGMMCSLSIPIITICALLLLMIIVSLLDFVFKWMPYFFICFPLPGFKAKDNA